MEHRPNRTVESHIIERRACRKASLLFFALQKQAVQTEGSAYDSRKASSKMPHYRY